MVGGCIEYNDDEDADADANVNVAVLVGRSGATETLTTGGARTVGWTLIGQTRPPASLYTGGLCLSVPLSLCLSLIHSPDTIFNGQRF